MNFVVVSSVGIKSFVCILHFVTHSASFRHTNRYWNGLFSLPVWKYRKSYCTTPGIGIGIGIGVSININVKVLWQSFKTLCFLNPQMDLVYIWYDYRCWSKVLLSTVHTPAHDLEVKVTDWEINIVHIVWSGKFRLSNHFLDIEIFFFHCADFELRYAQNRSWSACWV